MLPTVIIEPNKTPDAAIIWLHGLGANGHDFESIAPELQLPNDLAIRYIFPHAPSIPVTINSGIAMPAWYDIISMSDIGRDINEQQFMASVNEVSTLIEAQIKDGISHQRIILAGFSQGGAVALHAGLTCNKPLAGILALSTYFPTSELITYQQTQSTPILITHGVQDPVVPITLGEQMVKALKNNQYQPEFKIYPMEHTLCLPQIQDISKWIFQIFGKN